MLVLGNNYHGFPLEYFAHCFFNNGVTSFRVGLLIRSCIIHQSCSVPSDANVYKDEVLAVFAVCLIIPRVVFTELLVSVLAVKYEFHDQRNLRHGGRCPSCKQYLLQSIHVLALWNILIAIQLVTKIATSICMLLLVHPQETAPLCHIFVNGAC